MTDKSKENQNPQSEGTGMQKEAERFKDGSGQPSDPKSAAAQASQEDDKAS